MIRVYGAALALSVLLFGGCLLKPYLPAPDASYAVEGRYAIVQNDSLAIYLRPQGYSGEAQEIGADFFTLHLRVRNTTSRPIRLGKQGFSILAGQLQYDYIPLQVVLGSVQTLYLVSQYEDPFAPTQPERQNQTMQSARTQYLELVDNYFSFGDILPGGVKEGYLFYSESVDRENRIAVDVLGTSVRFEK